LVLQGENNSKNTKNEDLEEELEELKETISKRVEQAT
jgi:hypothetical protein